MLLFSWVFIINPTMYNFTVGSGTAGSVIAHNLVTKTNFTFIVIEAGGESNSLFEIPVLGPMLHNSVFDWQYETIPQQNACLAMNYKKCKLPQGKIVGGSSKLNNMVHIRGNISHYASWFYGKYHESYLNRHFDMIEKNLLHLNEVQYESEMATAIAEAAEELGYSRLGSEFKVGYRKSKLSQKNGKRWTISDNLDSSKYVLSNALVEKVIIVNDIAKGVTVQISDKKHNIFARKGVILSAGTINTPKILQLSGIGPPNILNNLNIPVIKNLPVGYNLQDHVTTGLDLILFNKTLSVNAMSMLDVFNVYQYFFHGKGPLTTAGCEAITFLSTKGENIPDIQFMVMPVGISSDRGSYLRLALGINDSVWEDYFEKFFDKHAATILPIVLHPKSKGQVHIITTDPETPPLIDPKYLSHDEDVKTLIKGLKLVQRFLNTKAMEKVGAFINPQHYPGCKSHTIFSDSYWDCYVRHLTLTSYHYVGTCSMGLTSSNSVVDTSFRVFGVANLYVADASVLPTLPSGNINAAVAMMASVFFDENINLVKKVRNSEHCHKYQLLYELIHKICLI
ncbi:unnamed protein product [Diatraea saccharalis]|uniref:Glucose-methanol-choline oxidoreductase N-terminal domain-containing protein n=1 Tax=Diatraea saccharalis TaxID=40085 RepID=A0A9P0C682_9NEOP|nr:unnamed protein product [Diatraea saccharalis]